MGAGEHDLIGATISSHDEARRDLAGDFGFVDRFAAQPPLRDLGQIAREPTSVTSHSPAKSRISARV